MLVDKNGELVAILSDGDLRRALMDENFDINNKAVNFASKNPKVIDNPEMLASRALEIIENYKIQMLIVVRNNKPIGTLHIHDLMKIGI